MGRNCILIVLAQYYFRCMDRGQINIGPVRRARFVIRNESTQCSDDTLYRHFVFLRADLSAARACRSCSA
jgi:hypothetical protein